MESFLAWFNLYFIGNYLGLNSMMMGPKQCNYTWIQIPEVLQTANFHFLFSKKTYNLIFCFSSLPNSFHQQV